jgi:serine/threonine protein kinase/Flp pilus assembly protein TadD
MGAMTPERWRRVEELFQAAVSRAADERDAWLENACAGDSELLKEVRDMVAADSTGDTVDRQIVSTAVEMVQRPVAEPGLRAGPYRLTRMLGRGGMGAVYLGERADGEYEAEVAVKLVHAGLDNDFIQRFRRERQALARLQHPNIARILDSGSTDTGLPYIVMELVRGVPITAYIKEKQLTRDQILTLYIEVCRAVSHAHHKLIVHRDLKPGNIMVEDDGTPKLLDFGICKLIEDAPRGGEALTAALLLTPDYASPEQIRGETVTVTSDIYSLGVILYELLTGRPPRVIAKLTPAAIAAAAEEPIPPLSQVMRETASTEQLRHLDTVLLKALHKDAERRYQSVDLFVDDLLRVANREQPLAGQTGETARPARPSRRRWIAAAALIAFLGGAGLAWRKFGNAAEPIDVNTMPVFLEAHRLLKSHPKDDTPELRLQRTERAISMFEQAAREHPHSAKIYAGLAEAYEGIADEAPGKYYDYMEKARITAMRGLALDDRIDDLHHTLGATSLFGAWDLPKALASFTRAVELNPRRGTSHRLRAEVLCMYGRFDEALAALNVAQSVAPLDPDIGAEKAAVYFRARRYAQAAEAARQTITIDPEEYMAKWILGMALQHQGSIAEAEAVLRPLPFRPIRNPIALAHLLASSGRTEEAMRLVEQIHKVVSHPSAEAIVYVAAGQRETALTLLEKAYAMRDMNVIFISMDPRYDAIRNEPRWIALCKKLGVPPNP